MAVDRTMWTEKARTLAFCLAMMAALLFGLLLIARPAHATTTFIVNSTGDGADADTTDNICDSDLGTAEEQCTLRAAIQQANATSGADEIHFSIPSSDANCDATTHVCTISPSSDLPAIEEAVTINGYTQGDSTTGDSSDDATENTLAQGNNAVLKIELSGTNASDGLRIQAANSTVKGLIINRFGTLGVGIDEGATGNKVEGNYIGTDAAGTDAAGTADLGNLYGVRIEGSNNTVGGTEAGARNLISGNVIGVPIFGSLATGNSVEGNYIGTDKDGDADLSNFLGVLINGASNNTVGGTEDGAGNVISGNIPSEEFGNNGDGVYITSPDATGNKVEGNYIGTDAAGTADLGNTGNGVRIDNGASNNTVGGTESGAGNIISGNGGDGVEISYYRDSNNPEDNDPTPPVGNRILSNSIYDNDVLGIELATPPNQLPGVTNNDPKDPDTGPNRRQNFPRLASATTDTTTTTITGMLNSRPRKSFTIQFFSSPDADPSGFGEGKTFLGEKNVKTNRRGKRSFSAQVDAPPTGENVITATATRVSTGDTSEFSNAVGVS